MQGSPTFWTRNKDLELCAVKVHQSLMTGCLTKAPNRGGGGGGQQAGVPHLWMHAPQNADLPSSHTHCQYYFFLQQAHQTTSPTLVYASSSQIPVSNPSSQWLKIKPALSLCYRAAILGHGHAATRAIPPPPFLEENLRRRHIQAESTGSPPPPGTRLSADRLGGGGLIKRSGRGKGKWGLIHRAAIHGPLTLGKPPKTDEMPH